MSHVSPPASGAPSSYGAGAPDQTPRGDAPDPLDPASLDAAPADDEAWDDDAADDAAGDAAAAPRAAEPARAGSGLGGLFAPPADSRLLDDVRRNPLPVAVAVAFFVILFAKPMQLLGRDWWNNPEAGHGLLLAPLALWLVWRSGVRADARPAVAFGSVVLVGAALLRYMSGLAAELYTMRMSMVMALVGVTVFAYGVKQAFRWWLPFALLWLSVPLPDLVTSTLAAPLQLQASQMGAALLGWRDVPVLLAGNIIHLPGGHQLFVAEACSGLRSLTALLSLGVLLGGMTLRWPASRLLLIAIAIPIAILINGIRVFLTGFLVFFVSPELGEGFMHTTEGWLMFLMAFVLLGAVAWVIGRGESLVRVLRPARLEAAHA